MGLVVLIDRPGYRLASDSKVLKGGDAVVIEPIASAYMHAEKQIETTLSELEQGCARAAEAAYQEGLAKAELDAAKRWTLGEADRLAMVQAMQPQLAEIVVSAIELLAREMDRQALVSRALEVLHASLREVRWARLRVHPDSAEAAQAALDEFDRRSGLGKLARVVMDESLPTHGCVLESERGTVDASLDTQLEAIRSAITERAGNVPLLHPA
jgi:type III secretion protein L